MNAQDKQTIKEVYDSLHEILEDMPMLRQAAFVSRCTSRLWPILNRKEEPDDWQHIETAPKDGVAVIGFQALPGDMRLIATIYFSEGAWRMVQYHVGNDEGKVTPTHWMPLPASPKGSV